jgi:hypothetical protein
LELKRLSPIEAIEFLHRGEGAAVTFHRKPRPPKKPWQDLGAIMLPALRTKWPSIAEHLHSDAYFSINSTYKQERCTKIAPMTGLPMYSRRAEQLRWLNCVVLDVDIYKIHPNCRRAEALEAFLAEITRNDVPQPSVVCFSGRGVWGLWVLRDDKNLSTPVPAFTDKRDVYQRVNEALAKHFACIGADAQCTDPSRVMRVPGSVNTSATTENPIVEFLRLGDDAHTLPELAERLGVTAQKIRLPGERTKAKNMAKVNAGLMRWRRPLEGFCQLWKMRGQFTTGVRRFAVYIYAGLLRRNRIPDRDVLEKCLRLAGQCNPVLPPSDVAHCVRSGRKLAARDFRHSITNAAIARMLRITAEEKMQLPEWFKPKRRRKSDRIAERRRLIARELQLAGKSLRDSRDSVSSRDVATLLVKKYGIRVSHVTILNDFRFLLAQCEAFTSADSPTGKFPVLVDSKSSLVPAEKTYQHRNPPQDWAGGNPINCALLRDSRSLKT